MSLKSEWKILDNRINSLLSILSDDWNHLIRVNNLRDTGVAQELNQCLSEWIALADKHNEYLTCEAKEVTEIVRNELTEWLNDNWNSQNSSIQLASGLRKLKVCASRFNYIIDLGETEKIQISERAFSHLQRRIIADSNYRDMWINAHRSGEVACEKLGGSHFLLHGVWCFKCDDTGRGGRTDLVMSEFNTTFPEDEVQRSANTLILTEWKRVTSSLNLSQAVDEALIQARRYSSPSGVLGAVELKNIRYLVVVSEDWEQIEPQRIEEDNLTFVVKNIVVNPSLPSDESRGR